MDSKKLDKSGRSGGLIHRKERQRLRKLEELFDRYGDSLYRYLVFRLGQSEDAEDVFQEVFCRLARFDLRWKLVRDPLAFVLRVARNEANRFLRRKLGRRKGEEVILVGAKTGLTAAFAAPDEPELALLLRWTDDLPLEQKEVLFLKVFDGLTFKEIASIFGVSANTAASRYRYAIEKLREAVGGES